MAIVELTSPVATEGDHSSIVVGPLGYARHWMWPHGRSPIPRNGEVRFAKLLKRRGIREGRPPSEVQVFYEPWRIELEEFFCHHPDFWTPGFEDRPERFYELTYLDHGIRVIQAKLMEIVGKSDHACAEREQLEAELERLLEKWRRKLGKREETRELHKIDIDLITFELCFQIYRDPQRMDDLILDYRLPQFAI